MGDQIWSGLGTLVARLLHRDDRASAGSARPGSGELAALGADPRNRAAAGRLAALLTAQAEIDEDFSQALDAWCAQARQAYPERRSVHNQMSGGTFHHAVIQTGAITNLNLGAGPAAPANGEEG